ncbi:MULTISPECIES: hypothetical protein [Enterobacteriaceae]|jgi:hypothetical protein|uniref:hypothetical protein n=1 Tax=Enterobacteriaceae TaxID=543 RepID=UPI0015DCBFBF|nr:MULTISPECIES: hypothetical protein [Enterobacteriaceae]MDU1196814.1 hypothetical protein [Kluyvera ascorbata]BBQ86595.1 hypothetical protein WP3W18E02_P20090 [Klebsiella sp. WP3-W18-ESBL-02]BBR23788.1 hypothetical protein WP3S18E05_P21230 [Klebsiella sp. WP3-S18-ESBL-05]
MSKGPQKRAKRTTIRSGRFNDAAIERMDLMLAENPLLKPSTLLRAGVLALYRLPKEERLKIEFEAAAD